MTPDWLDPEEISALEAFELLRDIAVGVGWIVAAFALLAVAAWAGMVL